MTSSNKSTELAPVLLSLSSVYSTNQDGSNSDLTFPLSQPISVPTATGAQKPCSVKVSLLSFTGVNSLSNVISTKNNVIKIIAGWSNNSTGQFNETLSTITIPQGYYSQEALQSYISSKNDFYDSNNNLLTFGNNTTSVNSNGETIYTYPGFDSDTISSKFIIQQFPALLTQTYSTGGQSGNTHEYRYFKLVVDKETIGILQLMGFMLNTEKTTKNFDSDYFQNDFTVYCEPTYSQNSSGYTTVSYTCYSLQELNANSVSTPGYFYPFNSANCIARYMYDMQPSKSLYVCMDGINARTIAPWSTQAESILLRVPVDVPYGSCINFSAPILYETVASFNTNISYIHISLKDDRNEFVDFQGTNWQMGILFSYEEIEAKTPSVSNPSVAQGAVSTDSSLQKKRKTPLQSSPFF